MDAKLKKHGAVSWSELITRDVDGAKDFYGKVFNWTFEDAPMEGETYTVFNVNGEEVGGMMPMQDASQGTPPAWGLYITVDDVDATVDIAVGLGAKVVMPPADIPEMGRYCMLQDPQGASISIISYTG